MSQKTDSQTPRRENKIVRAARELRDAVAKAMDDMPPDDPSSESFLHALERQGMRVHRPRKK